MSKNRRRRVEIVKGHCTPVGFWEPLSSFSPNPQRMVLVRFQSGEIAYIRSDGIINCEGSATHFADVISLDNFASPEPVQ